MTPLHNALTPPALVLAGLRAALVQDVPNLSFVYDPGLDWEGAAKSQRAQRAMQDGSPDDGAIPDQAAALNATQFPLMAFKRSALVPLEGRSRRNAWSGYQPVGIGGWDLRFFVGEMRVGWKVYSRDVLELEAIEMGYVAHSLMSSIEKFSIPIAVLVPATPPDTVPPDALDYELQWDQLNPEIEIQHAPAMLYAIEGSLTIRGAFVTGASDPLGKINTIDLKIEGYDNALLSEVIVTRRQ